MRLNAHEAFAESGWLRTESRGIVWGPQDVFAGEIYTIPNTFIFGVAYAGMCTSLVAYWQMKVTEAAVRRGVDTLTYRYDVGDPVQSFERLTRTLRQSHDLWAAAFFGHGYRLPGEEEAWGEELSGHYVWDKKKQTILVAGDIGLRHRLALVIAYFCYADQGEWQGLVSGTGKYYGGTGMISCLAGPRAVGWWGSWDALVGSALD